MALLLTRAPARLPSDRQLVIRNSPLATGLLSPVLEEPQPQNVTSVLRSSYIVHRSSFFSHPTWRSWRFSSPPFCTLHFDLCLLTSPRRFSVPWAIGGVPTPKTALAPAAATAHATATAPATATALAPAPFPAIAPALVPAPGTAPVPAAAPAPRTAPGPGLATAIAPALAPAPATAPAPAPAIALTPAPATGQPTAAAPALAPAPATAQPPVAAYSISPSLSSSVDRCPLLDFGPIHGYNIGMFDRGALGVWRQIV